MQETKTITEVLFYIQKNLIAPKGQYNSFGKYNYRSCEDILEGLKKVMPEGAAVLIQDDIAMIGNRIYVKATATLHYAGQTISNTAFARESEEKKGMDSAQVTGATSSYARKYALNGLFLIDDTKDADSMDNSGATPAKSQTQQRPPANPSPSPAAKPKSELKETAARIAAQLRESQTIEVCNYVWNGFKDDLDKIKIASPDKAYKTLQKIYSDRLAALSQAPDDDNLPPF